MVIEYAYSKINLALEVMDLVNGYHMVNNLMIPITLHDEVILEESETIYMVDNYINDNICIKAAKLFMEYYKLNKGVKITLIKHIPLAAGLAGGSTDAAAVLKGLAKLYRVNASKSELEEIASKLGSDVPFFIGNSLAMCTGRGEKINPIEFRRLPIDFVLVKPLVGLSTQLVYQNYKYNPIDRTKNIKNIYKALEDNDIELLQNNIFNDLGSVALSLNSDMKELYDRLTLAGARVFVSGSGPTMFIFNKSYEDIKNIINDEKVFVFAAQTK